jgi:hypothetical protein
MILDMTYGYEVKGRHDKKLDISKRVNDFVIVTFLPGALLVNELPFCMYSPTLLSTSNLSSQFQYAISPLGCLISATSHLLSLAVI